MASKVPFKSSIKTRADLLTPQKGGRKPRFEHVVVPTGVDTKTRISGDHISR